MKIIHTSDWHLGKELHQTTLDEDHRLFIAWLITYITDNQIDVVLISGDIFDHANPSNEARKMYFGFLTQMAAQKVQVVITGGNHDSITMLESSRDLLGLLNVHVVAGMPEDKRKAIIPLHDKKGEITSICLALPFLRDKDLRSYAEGESQGERIDKLTKGIVSTDDDMHKLAEEMNVSRMPVIAMGHLYLQGASTSESEREVQLGNAAAVSSGDLSNMFDYLALGHIHRPQKFDGGRVRYSGSPISLSFSERKDEKYIVVIEIKGHELEINNVEVPKNRALVKIEGSWQEVKDKLEETPDSLTLPNLYDLEITAEISLIPEIESHLQLYRDRGLKIARRKIIPPGSLASLSQQMDAYVDLSEMDPWEVFEKKMAGHAYTDEEKTILREVYRELLDEVYHTIAL